MKGTVKKAMAMGVAIMLGVLGFTACSSTEENTGKVQNTPAASPVGDVTGNGSQGITNHPIAFEKLEDEALPEVAAGIVEKLKPHRGFTWLKDGEDNILLVFMGEKNTGGYGIEVKSIEDIEGITKVTVQEKEPAKDDMVTTVMTYLYTAVKFKGASENFEVVNEEGAKFSLLSSGGNLGGQVAMEATGTYEGQADGNSIEIIVDENTGVAESGQTAVFRFTDEVKAYFDVESKEYKNFQRRDRFKFSYIKNEHSQLVITNLVKI